MLGELNRLLESRPTNDADSLAVMPTYTGYNGFLNHVIVPLYSILKAVGFGVRILEQCVILLLSAYRLGLCKILRRQSTRNCRTEDTVDCLSIQQSCTARRFVSVKVYLQDMTGNQACVTLQHVTAVFPSQFHLNASGRLRFVSPRDFA
jgi:hypothetical protein